MANARGEDRSNFQNIRPWTGLDFGGCKATEGLGFIDHTFISNWETLKAAGIPRIAYAFFHPAEDPQQQALFFYGVVKAAGLGKGDFLAADVEISSGVTAPSRTLVQRLRGTAVVSARQNVPAKIRGLTAGAVNDAAKVFLDTLVSLAGPHVRVIIYTNRNVGMTLTSCSGYPLWVAWYAPSAPADVSPWHDYLIWQNGQAGPAGGDADEWHGTYAQMKEYVAKFSGDTPKPPPPPPPVKKEIPEAMILNTGAGAQTPVTVQDGATKLRFSTLAGTTAKLQVLWGETGIPVEVSASGHAGAIPVAGDAATVTRTDAGTNPVSVIAF